MDRSVTCFKTVWIFSSLNQIQPRIDGNAPDFMVDLQWTETIRSNDHSDEAWNNILALEGNRDEWRQLILPLLFRIEDCLCAFVEGAMRLVGIEQQILFHVMTVFVLVVGVSDEARQ